MTLAALTFPRDLSVLIVATWIWLGFWTSNPPPRRESVEDQIGRWVVGRWMGVPVPRRRTRVERFRNGWTFLAGSVLAVGLIVLIYATNPYLWVL